MEAVTQPTPGTAPARTLVALDDVPELQRIPRTTRWRLARSGAFRCYRIGAKLFTTAADIEAYLAASVVVKGGAANG